jgi:hypothetical protein
LLDGLVVPLPKLCIQAAVADAARSLSAVWQRVEQLSAELWHAPERAINIQRAAGQWLDPEMLLRSSEVARSDDEKTASL